jgi:hypothetical protein
VQSHIACGTTDSIVMLATSGLQVSSYREVRMKSQVLMILLSAIFALTPIIPVGSA